jgi:phosphodiesterase/alkaline phosphatase D-like protein
LFIQASCHPSLGQPTIAAIPPEPFAAMKKSLAAECLKAVDLALAGEWEEAHIIVQGHEGNATADWIHAVLHRIEGDDANSRYWYRCAGRPAPAQEGDTQAELKAIRELLASGPTSG